MGQARILLFVMQQQYQPCRLVVICHLHSLHLNLKRYRMPVHRWYHVVPPVFCR